MKGRRKGQTILEALFEMGLKQVAEIQKFQKKETQAFMKLIRETPELALYAQQMWLRHEKSLAKTIQTESKKKMTLVESESIARFILDSFHRAITDKDPQSALKAMMKILQKGWKE